MWRQCARILCAAAAVPPPGASVPNAPSPSPAESEEADGLVAAPRLLVAAAQPYHTTAGPALTVHFARQPQLLPLQARPFSDAAAAPQYFHALLHALAELCETPRPSRAHPLRAPRAPKPDLWRAVGVLNTFYATHHLPAWGPPDAPLPAAAHPAQGAAELCGGGRRAERDVRLTLYDAAHRAVSSMVMTGPGSGPPTPADGAAPTLRRAPLPPLQPPAGREGYEPPVVPPPLPGVPGAHGGVYGPLERIGSSYAQRAFFSAPGAEGLPLPPWVALSAVPALAARLHAAGALAPAVPPPPPGAGPPEWVLAAHQHTQVGDAALGAPLELVCAPPRAYGRYRLPPWRRQIGMPDWPGARPCAALHLETRQAGQLVAVGTYFLTPADSTMTEV